MLISGIYKIQSIIKPERIYIGSSINIYERWGCHLKKLKAQKHHSKKLQFHYNKYGQSDLQFTILLGCEIEDLIKTEQYFLDSYNPWFNICKNAGSTLGRKMSKEMKLKMSILKKGIASMTHTEESKRKLSKAFKGKPLSEDTKQKMKEGWEKRRLKLNKPKSKYLIKKYGT